MTSYLSHTSVDCSDAYELSKFWGDVLGYAEDPDDPNEPGHEECMIFSADDHHRILFIEVPEPKQVKNRIHFDLRPEDRTQAEEVAWLLDQGATQLNDLRRPGGGGWVVLADPEGNEFCILLSDAELAAANAQA